MGISMTVRTSGFRKWSEAHDPKIAVRAVASELPSFRLRISIRG